MWRCSVLLEQHVIGTLFFQNRHEKLTVSCMVNYITRIAVPTDSQVMSINIS
jgi:hypothetical protein